MPAPSRHGPVQEALPTARTAISYLREQGQEEFADAVTLVADYAEHAARTHEQNAAVAVENNDPAFTVTGPSDLILRAQDVSPNLTRDVREGLKGFLAGEWAPEQPVRAPHGSNILRGSISVRMPRDLVSQVNEVAAEYAQEHGFRGGRGYALNARQVALQWLARKYPAPDDTE